MANYDYTENAKITQFNFLLIFFSHKWQGNPHSFHAFTVILKYGIKYEWVSGPTFWPCKSNTKGIKSVVLEGICVV